ncbi:hypothetical protein ABMA28_003812 [Loxostege sticticalis]|uniref:Uncharacterized protein n=1 Tax=Loxostege sticticalis TaxID=481309 RepID=A0ABD0ST35_LOXSC
MKYAMIFLLCCVAFAAAAPQLLTWPGYAGVVAPGFAPYGRTLVAGPTVLNGFAGSRYIAPGYVGPYF